MQVNDVIRGFRVTRRREVPELNGVFWEFVHERSGAQLAWLDNGEENKLFSVAFKTLPWDDTGVFHIMEHSVLGGSEHYPVKEPFLDLLKSSMNTFLNAMTYPDKTVYPVSSRNTQDFLNLTEVYLDAVFCPAVYTDPNIFRQEGWHYELRGEADEPVYKGVVFNEMKGAYANIDSLMDKGLTGALFPDTSYGFDSGGDPAAIPTLTYERFLDAHRHFYHPSNARIWLDGDVPLDRVLALMDEKYLSRYERSDALPEIAAQRPVPACVRTRTYAVGANEETAEKTHIVLGKILCTWEDRKKITAAQLLADYLTDTNASPLKRAILSAGLAQDVELYLEDEVYQPYLTLQLRNTEYDRLGAIRACVRDTVRELLDRGLDREELEAELNQLAFSLRDPREPKGLARNLNALCGWLHGGDPLAFITYEPLLASLREALDTDYYARLLKEMLLDDAHLCAIAFLPSKTKGEEDAAREAAALKAAAAGWTQEDRRRIVEENAALDLWHNTPDSKEATATLPVLRLSDVDAAPTWAPTDDVTAAGAPMWYHKLDTNGIVHVRALFNVNDAPMTDLPVLSFLADLFGELPTAKYDVKTLQREIKKTIGRLDFDVASYAEKGEPGKCRVRFLVSFSVLQERLAEAQALVSEILLHTDFTAAALIRELLLQTTDDVYQSILVRGNAFAVRRANAAFSAASAVQELTDGFRFYAYVKAFDRNFETAINAFCVKAASLCETFFTRARLTLSETASSFLPPVAFVNALPAGAEPGPAYSVAAPAGTRRKEAVCIPSGVSYAAASCNVRLLDGDFTGPLNVLSNILTYGYLWNEIRVKGGAYGCGFRVGHGGNAAFYSYRDPAPLASLSVFAATADFIRAFVASEEETDKYIISTIANDEPLIGPSSRGAAEDAFRLTGVTFADRKRIRDEMLAMKKEDLLALVPLFEKMAEAASVCVVGNEAAMEPELEDFSRIEL